MDNGMNLTSEEIELLDRLTEEAHTEEIPIENSNLPINSNVLLIDESTSRFSSAEWFDEINRMPVILAGLGGIGSHLAFMLSRVNVGQLILYDSDIVDSTNMSGQLYGHASVGEYKASAIKRFITNYSNYFHYQIYNENFNWISNAGPVMICGFDNMESRKIYFSVWKKYLETLNDENKKRCLFMDGRLAAEEFQVFCIKGTDKYLMNKYEKEWLFLDSEAEETLCSYKQTSFCANMIASVMTNLLVNFVVNLCNPIIERALPFYTEYSADKMYFKTEMQ